MYSYYFLSAFGPQMQKFLWWKKYLTQLQITQFVVAMIHGAIPLCYDCGYPKMYVYLAMPQGVLFLYLFIQFYVDAYNDRQLKARRGIKVNNEGFATVCTPQTGVVADGKDD